MKFVKAKNIVVLFNFEYVFENENVTCLNILNKQFNQFKNTS